MSKRSSRPIVLSSWPTASSDQIATSRDKRLRPLSVAAFVALLAYAATQQGPIEAQVNCRTQPNPIQCENTKPGNADSEWDVTGAGDQTLQGFTTEFSVAPGETVRFKIDAGGSGTYSINIYRMGYYQGLGARRVASLGNFTGQNQVNCLAPAGTAGAGLIDCGNWAESATWAVPNDSVSGIYFARLQRAGGGDGSHIFFVVRDDDGGSDLLFQTSDTTWQAYNDYGGNSLYVGGPGTNPGRAYKVSYNRPFITRLNSPQDWVFNAEYPMVRWLEANGYDVSYTSGVDTDFRAAELLEHKVFMSVGHDEYWSAGQRANVEAARAAGKHLAFFSANEIFWKTRWEPSIDGSNTARRTLVSYKETHANQIIDPANPPITTATWRDPRFGAPADGNRPEHALTGTRFRVNDGTTNIAVPEAMGKLRFWRGTSIATLAAGQTYNFAAGTLGYEWDEAPDDALTPPGLMRLSLRTAAVPSILLDNGSSYGAGTATHSMTLYRHSSGALVFSAGTIQYSWALDSTHDRGSAAADVRMKQATVNLFADMGVQPSTLEAGLNTAQPSSDNLAPTSLITAPAAGASIPSGTAVTITGTATENAGGIVTSVEVSTDGGTTWARATGTTAWTFAWVPTVTGARTIRARAYDDSGNRETPSAGVTVNITAGQTCPCTIWAPTAVPPVADDGDPGATEIGTRFRSDLNGYITGVRFYKAAANTGTHVGRLWTNNGVLLGAVTFTNETASGWQQANFPSAIPINANTTYIVTYHAPSGHYTGQDNGFAANIDRPPMHGLRDGLDGVNGVYRYGSGGVFPTDTYQSEAYWVDAVFNTVPPADTTPPTITARTPAASATGVLQSATVSVTFSEAMNPATIFTGTTSNEGGSTLGSFELRDSAGILVSASVAYDMDSRVATLTPDSPLLLNTTYTATVRGGTVDPRVKDLASNALAATSTWTFTTVAAPPPPPACPCTIWRVTDVPPVADDLDPGATEIGTRFRSDVAGFVTGVRFYKAPLNTGTHTGRLWSSTGTLLGTVTFSGESASGWQQANFASPIAISANTSYIVTYHAPNGHYTGTDQLFLNAIDNPPLHALRDGVDGANGVYRYGAGGVFPTNTFQAEAYWVDVVFNTSIGPDTTPPIVSAASPIGGLSGVGVDTNVLATFHEGMNAATITTTTFTLRDAQGNVVPATVTYNATTQTATLDPSAPLAYLTMYTATVKGGTTDPRVKDIAGNALASDYVWSFSTQAPPPPPPWTGPGGPVLVFTSSANPFSTYYAEILRTEGLNAFATADIGTLDQAADLNGYDVVIIGEMPLTAAQVGLLTTWVNAGGNLITFRPDKQLAGLLGLTDAGTTLSNAYLLVNTAAGTPGAGIVNQTIQFHGTADRYTLTAGSGSVSVATLYSNATTATTNPAVTRRAVGSGNAVAFTYDLARSVVYTRQGNPAWSGQERDGLQPPIMRSDDLFFGARAGDVQPDWIDLTKVAIPQADEQQRLLWNTILFINASKKPLPRFWYFPRMLKAVVIMTGDDHGNGGTVGRFDQYAALSPAGCSVANWECVRGTSYIYPTTPITAAQIDGFVTLGFEIASHINTGCADWTVSGLPGQYDTNLQQFAAAFPTAPPPRTNRTHCIVWSDYATQPQVELDRGIRFDTNYYYWPGSWILDRPGMFTGSGMPMRFTSITGQMLDIYQAPTQMTDESNMTWPLHPNSLLDKAIGAEGYYGAFTANMHTDHQDANDPGRIGSDAIIGSAQARGVPVISAKQMLDWLDGRNGSSFGSISWGGNVLGFTIAVGANATGLHAMVPASAGGSNITSITVNGASRPIVTQLIKGVQYAVFPAESGNYVVSYGVDGAAPQITNVAHSVTNTTAQITWTTNEPSNSEVVYGTAPAALNLTETNPAVGVTHSVTLANLASNTTYFYRVRSTDGAGNTGVSPATGNPAASFTTPTPSLSVAGVSVTEGNAGTTNAGFVVTLSFASTQTVTVNYATTNGTATAGSDYTAAAGSLTFSPGEITKTINVPVLGDLVSEGPETFTLSLSGATNATIGTASAVGSIVDDEAQPTISIGNVTVAEGNTGTTNAVFTVTLSGTSASSITVAYATASGTATVAGGDYITTSGTLTFAPGATSQTITVPVGGDVLDEADEQFTVNLSNPTNAAIATASGTATITDDDPLPSITISDVSVTEGNLPAEGNPGTTNATFTLTLSAVSGRTVTVAYATANGTATAGSDFVSSSGTATFTAGSTTATVTVVVTGDVLFEPAETFAVDLSAATNATIADPQGTGTILNDEPTPSLSIGNAVVAEGNAGTVNAVFTVSLSSGSAQTVTVSYATAANTAAEGADYTAATGTLTFAPGVTGQTVTVPVAGDTLNEADEQFSVTLSNPVNAPITPGQGTGVGTIVNDDPLPSIAIGDAAVIEGNAGTTTMSFAVTLSAPSGRQVTVAYGTADGTASAASDYTAASGTLTFDPGATSATVNVTVAGDTLPESTETFAVNLSAATNATIADAQATGTITNDEPLPSLAIAGASVAEGNAGTASAVFTVTLSPASSQTVTVNYASANGTASSASDYTAASGTLTFAAGETTKTITVAVNGDVLYETDEQFVVNLTGAVAATIATAQGVGTITNDDPLPSISIGDVAVTEGNAGTKLMTFTLTLSGASGQTITVGYSTANGTATAGSDYAAAANTAVFAAGATTANVPITINGDAIFEGDETFVVDLAAPTNATIGDGQATGTIQNDEATPALSITDVTVTEGNAGTVNAVLNVTLSPVSSLPVTVNWATANATATAGSDYTAASGTLTFAPGVAAQSITTVVTGDVAIEPNETYQVNLTLPSGATLLDGQGIVTITNDEVSGLVAAYSFNEGTGTTVGDTSGNNNNGTIAGATWSTAGHAGNALSFDGANDMVSITDSASLDVIRVTLMAWVRPTSLSGWRSVILKERGTDGLAYGLYAHDNAPRPSAYVNVSNLDREVQGTSALPLNTWTHLTMTYDGTSIRLYVNGTLTATRAQTGNITVSAQKLAIGGNTPWGEFFAGLIDDVRIYNRALSAAEITTDMNTPVQ